MNKKEELKGIIDALNNFMGKIDSVDEPKQQPKYPEGILSFKMNDGGISTHGKYWTYDEWCEFHLEKIPISTIHSVKNSKGEVLQVGDEVCYRDSLHSFKINHFELNNVSIDGYCESVNAPYKIPFAIDYLTKAEPKKEPLFKTEDGYEIFDGDNFWLVNNDLTKNRLIGNKNIEKLRYLYNTSQPFWRHFKIESNADKCIAENKKSISYKELEDWVREYGIISVGFTTPLLCDIEQLLKHFKPKQS